MLTLTPATIRYTSQFYMAPDGGIDACLNDSSNPLFPTCANTTYQYANGWLIGAAADPLSSWLHKATQWVPIFMQYLKDTWADPAGNLPLVVSEMGFAEPYEAEQTLRENILTDPIRTQCTYTDGQKSDLTLPYVAVMWPDLQYL